MIGGGEGVCAPWVYCLPSRRSLSRPLAVKNTWRLGTRTKEMPQKKKTVLFIILKVTYFVSSGSQHETGPAAGRSRHSGNISGDTVAQHRPPTGPISVFARPPLARSLARESGPPNPTSRPGAKNWVVLNAESTGFPAHCCYHGYRPVGCRGRVKQNTEQLTDIYVLIAVD